MADIKINKKIVVPYLLSFIFLFASYLIYTTVPVSDIANSVEHSGMDAVYILISSPVCAFVSLVLLLVTFIINFKHMIQQKFKVLYISEFALLSIFVLVSTVFSVMFVVSQFKLGFTAPINDTVWHTYSKFILANVILQFLFALISVLSVKFSTAKAKA